MFCYTAGFATNAGLDVVTFNAVEMILPMWLIGDALKIKEYYMQMCIEDSQWTAQVSSYSALVR